MRIDNIKQPIKYPVGKRYPLPLFKGNMVLPQPIVPLFIGSISGIILMDYLMRMSLLNQYYHDSIGVYKA